MESGLIQMNAHMVVTAEAHAMMIVGVAIAGICILLAVLSAISKQKKHKGKYIAAFAALAMVGVVFLIVGANQPRQKVIRACASGPVSLEQIAAIYNIKEVDGKMLTLVER